MRSRRKVMLCFTFACLFLAGFILAGVSGCGGGGEEKGDEYQRGYEDGVKAERAKWSDAKLQLARTMIEEQEARQETLQRLLKGEITTVKVGEITVSGSAAKVNIQAVFTDGTVINGFVDLVQLDNKWYLQKVTAERGSTPS